MMPSREAFVWFIAAVVCAWLVGPAGPVYWDSFSYVGQAVTGHIGGLGVGRPLFAYYTQAVAGVWQWAGGSVWDLEPVLRVACLLVSAVSVPLSRRLALEVGMSGRAATLTAALVAASPAFAHSSFTVLTDGMATTFVLLTWIAGLRAVKRGTWRAAALAGLWFGVAIGLREASVFSGLTMLCISATAPRGRRLGTALVFLVTTAVVVVVPMVWVYVTQPGYLDTIRGWLDGLRHDRELKRWTWAEVRLLCYWLVLFGPAALLLAMASARRWRQWGDWRFSLVVPAWAQWGVMATYMGIAYSPRYLMTAFPAAVAMPAAWLLDRMLGRRPTRVMWVWIVLALLVPLVAARQMTRRAETPILAIANSLAADLAQVPADAVVVTGHACPGVPMLRELARVDPPEEREPPAWLEICPGWGWPDDLEARLDAHLSAGRHVVIDLRPTAWRGDEQLRSLAQLHRYLAARSNPRPAGLIVWAAIGANGAIE